MSKKFYIEAGAHDGITGSRSKEFMDDPSYEGILVEPTEEVFLNCVKNRKNNRTQIYNCALVPFSYQKETITMQSSNIHTAMNTSILSDNSNMITHSFTGDTYTVQARTLQSILDENNITEIEYMFLDVEGAEKEVIDGIDHTKTTIQKLEIEPHHWRTMTLEKEVLMHINNLKKFNIHLVRIYDYKMYFKQNKEHNQLINYKDVYNRSWQRTDEGGIHQPHINFLLSL